MFGLIDGNNFYVSCERAFDPTLICKPVIVLSNNDGCAIARSAEAKALGIKMGEVWHLSKRKPEYRSVVAKSSHYALYGDMSRRVFEVLSEDFQRVEPFAPAVAPQRLVGWPKPKDETREGVDRRRSDFDFSNRGRGEVAPNTLNRKVWGETESVHEFVFD